MLGHPARPAPVQVGAPEPCAGSLISLPSEPACTEYRYIKKKKKPTHKGGSDSTGSQVMIVPMQEDTYCSSTPPKDRVRASTEQTKAEVSLPRTTAMRETHCRRPRSPSSRATELCPHIAQLCGANNQEWFGRQRTLRLCRFQLWGR